MKISSLLREAPKGPALSLDNDLMQRAMLRFPGYDSQQALSLYIADKAVQQQKTDAAQNNLINTQQNAIKSIGQELQDYEAQAQETDREVERLKQLSGALTTGSADRQQKAKVSADELEKLQKDLEDLKTKPGMDPEKYKEIEQQISALANSNGAEDADVKKLQNLVNNIQNKANVNYDAVAAQLEKTKQDLDDKEERFSTYIDNTNTYKKQTSQQLADTSTQLKQFAQDANELKTLQAGAKNDATEIRGLLNAVTQLYKSLAKKPGSEQQNTNYPNLYGNTVDTQAEGVNHNQKQLHQLNEEGRLDWSNEQFNKWMEINIPFLYKNFITAYKQELTNANPPYTKKQILDTLQDEAVYIKIQLDQGVMPSSEMMDHFLKIAKNALFQQKPDPQLELTNESVDMLDRIINLSSIKKG
jgi:chromosome segregation ATPase